MVDWDTVVGAPGDDYGDIDPPWDPAGHLGGMDFAFQRFMAGGYGGIDRWKAAPKVSPAPAIYDRTEWTDGSGQTYPVDQMTIRHAENTLKYLVRTNGEQIKDTQLGKALTARIDNG